MKKIGVILLALTLSTPLWAKEKGSDVFDVHCTVSNDRDGDQVILRRDFKMKKAKGASFTEHFTIAGLDHDLVTQLYYYEDDGVFVLELGDLTSGVGAQTLHHKPDYLYVFLGTEDVGVFATCSFKKTKI